MADRELILRALEAGDIHGDVADAIYRLLAETEKSKEKQHDWEFYFDGSFCKKCGTQLGSGQPCR